MKAEALYLEQTEMEQLQQEIASINSRLNKEVDEYRKAIAKEEEKFNEINRLREMLASKREDYERAVVIKKQLNDDIVDINDVVVADVNGFEDQFKLVSGKVNIDAEIPEVSLNSPIGSAVYKKKVGERCFYTAADKRKNEILIKAIRDLDLEQNSNLNR